MKRTNKVERLSHIGKWRASGLSRRAYSRLHGLKYSTFLSWFKKEQTSTEPGRFVALPESGNSSGALAIYFPNGIRLEYEGPLDEALIQSLQNA